MSASTIRRSLVLLASAALLTALTGTTVAAGDRTTPCKHGGWKFQRTGDGAPFRNQGRCVAWARHGGPLVLVIAYSDLDGDHTFSSGDVLINKLVDTSGDGWPGAGDTIVTGHYPADFTASTFKEWGVSSLQVTALDQVYVIPREVSVYTAGGRHEWHESSGADYYSESGTFPIFSAIHDRIGTAVPGDSITADPGSPSQPEPTLLERTGPADDRFIDVDVLFE